MEATDMQARLEDLLEETGHKHHAAYIEADGVDPEWASWYASYVQARMWAAAGRLPSRSELVYLLIAAERARAAAGTDEAWPGFYARFMLEQLGKDPA